MAVPKWLQQRAGILAAVFCVTLCAMLLPLGSALFRAEPAPLPAPDAGGMWGYVDRETGQTRIPARYTEAGLFNHGFAVVGQAQPPVVYYTVYGEQGISVAVCQGLIAEDGHEVLPVQYYSVRPAIVDEKAVLPEALPALYLVSDGDGVGLFHAEKGWLLPIGKQGRIFFEKDGSYFYGALDVYDGGSLSRQAMRYHKDGKTVAAPSGYAFTGVEPGGKALRLRVAPAPDVPRKRNPLEAPAKIAIADMQGKLLSAEAYQEIQAVSGCGRWAGLILPEGYKERSWDPFPFSEEDADGAFPPDAVRLDIFDAAGKEWARLPMVKPPEWAGDTIRYISGGREHTLNVCTLESRSQELSLIFRTGGKYGIKSQNGTVTVPPTYGLIMRAGGDLFSARKSGAGSYKNDEGIIDASGRVILPLEYGYAAPVNPHRTRDLFCIGRYEEGEAEPGSRKRSFGLADRTGKILVPLRYDRIVTDNNRGELLCSLNGKVGLLSPSFQEILPHSFGNILDPVPFEGGQERLYQVGKGNLWGLYNEKGVERVPLQYELIHLSDYELKHGWVRTQAPRAMKIGARNLMTGIEVAPEHSSIAFLGSSVAFCRGNFWKDCTLLDADGQKVAEFEEIAVDSSPHFYITGRQGGKKGLFDVHGKELIPCRYDELSDAGQFFRWGKIGDTKVLVDMKGKEYRLP